MSSPIGRSTSAAHAASSPTSARSSAAGRSGSVIVGHSARAARGARRVQALPALDRRRVAGGGCERGRRALAVLGVDEHAARRVGGQRRVGRDPPPARAGPAGRARRRSAAAAGSRGRRSATGARRRRATGARRPPRRRRGRGARARAPSARRAPGRRRRRGRCARRRRSRRRVASRAPSVGEQVRVDRHEAVDVVHVAVELGDDDRVLLARLDAQVLDRGGVALGQRALLGVGARDLARQLRVAAQRGGQRLDVGLGRRRRRAGARG